MNKWQFIREERETHKRELSQYARKMAYVSSKELFEKEVNTAGTSEEFTYLFAKFNVAHPTAQWTNDHCDNLNLRFDNRGGWCEHCQHYHMKWANAFDVKIGKARYVGQELSCWWNPDEGRDCMSFGNTEPEFINPGKYRSDWTSFDWAETGDNEKVRKPRKKYVERPSMRDQLKEKYPEIYSDD